MPTLHLKPNLNLEFASYPEMLGVAWRSLPWLWQLEQSKHAPQPQKAKLLRQVSQGIARAVDADIQIQGLEFLPNQPCILAPLHEGLFDIIALLHLPIAMTFAARSELLEWQWLGSIFQATNVIEVNPEQGISSYRRLLCQAKYVLRDQHLVIFPQGSVCGLEIAFQRGAFGIAKALQVPIVPIVLTGSHTIWDHPFNSQIHQHQRIILQILEPVQNPDIRNLERQMKHLALEHQPRRFDPEKDGFWDSYKLEIDPDYPDLVTRMQSHRSRFAKHNK